MANKTLKTLAMEKCYVFDQTEASGLVAYAKLRGKTVRFVPEPKEEDGPEAEGKDADHRS